MLGLAAIREGEIDRQALQGFFRRCSFPNLFGDTMLETETYILVMVWTVIGFFYFRQIIKKDHARRFGKAIVVWIALLALVIFMAMIWSGRVDEKATSDAIYAVQEYYVTNADEGVSGQDEAAFIQDRLDEIHRTDATNTAIVTGLFIMALGAMLINHLSMQKWGDQGRRGAGRRQGDGVQRPDDRRKKQDRLSPA